MESLGGGFEAEPGEPHVAIYPGPAASLLQFRRLVDDKPELIPVREFARWSETAAFPQLPSREAFRVWRRMKLHPRFDGRDIAATPPPPRNWRGRPIQGDLNATNDKRLLRLDGGAAALTENSTPPTTSDSSSPTLAHPPVRGTPRAQ